MEENKITIEKAIEFCIENCQKEHYIEVQNKNTKEFGTAVPTIGGDIKVFEGKDGGTDDVIYSVSEFKKKYKVTGLLDAFGKYVENIADSNKKDYIVNGNNFYSNNISQLQRKSRTDFRRLNIQKQKNRKGDAR